MKVKDFLTILQRYKDADFFIDGREVGWEAYQDHTGRFVFNITMKPDDKKSVVKNEKSLDK